jgi:hypothetical protein
MVPSDMCPEYHFAASLPVYSNPSMIDWCNMQATLPWGEK